FLGANHDAAAVAAVAAVRSPFSDLEFATKAHAAVAAVAAFHVNCNSIKKHGEPGVGTDSKRIGPPRIKRRSSYERSATNQASRKFENLTITDEKQEGNALNPSRTRIETSRRAYRHF